MAWLGAFRSFCAAALVLAAALPFVAVSPRPTEAQPQPSTENRFDDLSTGLVYAELKSRGLDPLHSTAPAAVRRAYVKYDFATGGGHNLLSSESSASIKELNAALSGAALTSVVHVKTKQPGARVKYRLFGEQSMVTLPQLTNDAQDTIPIGLYSFWSERDGKATSRPETFRIIRPVVPIEIEEVLR